LPEFSKRVEVSQKLLKRIDANNFQMKVLQNRHDVATTTAHERSSIPFKVFHLLEISVELQ